MDPYLRRRLLMQHAQEQLEIQRGIEVLRRVDDIVDANRRLQGRFVDMVQREYYQHQHHDHSISGCRYPYHHPNCRYAQTNHAQPFNTTPTPPQHAYNSPAPNPAASSFGPSSYPQHQLEPPPQRHLPTPARQPPPLRRTDDEDWHSNYPSRVPHAPDPPRRPSSPWRPDTYPPSPYAGNSSAMPRRSPSPYRSPTPRPESRNDYPHLRRAAADPYRSPPPPLRSAMAPRAGTPHRGWVEEGPYSTPPRRSASRASARASPRLGTAMETVMAMRREEGSYPRDEGSYSGGYGDTRSPRAGRAGSVGRSPRRVQFDDEDEYDDADRWW